VSSEAMGVQDDLSILGSQHPELGLDQDRGDDFLIHEIQEFVVLNSAKGDSVVLDYRFDVLKFDSQGKGVLVLVTVEFSEELAIVNQLILVELFCFIHFGDSFSNMIYRFSNILEIFHRFTHKFVLLEFASKDGMVLKLTSYLEPVDDHLRLHEFFLQNHQNLKNFSFVGFSELMIVLFEAVFFFHFDHVDSQVI